MQVFVDVAGQDDNLGDSVLRRGLLDALRASGTTLHVHSGDNSESYVSGLELPDEDVQYSSRRAWRNALLQSVGREKTSLAIDPGEIRSDAEMNFAGPRVIAAAAAVRLRGGAVIHSGIGLRAASHPRDRGTRVLARLSSVTTWRDEPSRARGVHGYVAPDWAFATGPSSPRFGDRSCIAVSMRGDRSVPNERWVELVNDLAESTQLTPVIFAQVRRDNELASWIAARVPRATVEIWPDEVNHHDREIWVRSLFARSLTVVSDRVHALIIGATEGAVPIGLTRNPEKLTRTLSGGGITGHTFDTSAATTHSDAILEASRRGDEIRASVQSSRAKLDELQQQIRQLLAR
ncbi:polysaccharide pyruvyl transferase family protein [Microbacterium sp. P03]|uniref:polysaccharide pyruvyl transferase family protein n=1 Tax=Microbacterium sp. P03 TaxID=3366946 RepID=UPI0037463D7A